MKFLLLRTAYFIALLSIIVCSPSYSQSSRTSDSPKIKAVAFDAFPIFDPRPIAKATEEAFPGHGSTLMSAWRTRIFEYQWLRALGGKYENFMQATEDALVFSTGQLNLELTEEKKTRLLSEFMSLNTWPDVPDSIRKLKDMNLELVFLSNMTENMLKNGLQNAGLEKDFKLILSTDLIQSYKPAPNAYQLGVEKLGLKKEEILFVAFAGWDVAGAKWYGYPTFWVNRLNSPLEELGEKPDAVGSNLSDLVEYIALHNEGK